MLQARCLCRSGWKGLAVRRCDSRRGGRKSCGVEVLAHSTSQQLVNHSYLPPARTSLRPGACAAAPASKTELNSHWTINISACSFVKHGTRCVRNRLDNDLWRPPTSSCMRNWIRACRQSHVPPRDDAYSRRSSRSRSQQQQQQLARCITVPHWSITITPHTHTTAHTATSSNHDNHQRTYAISRLLTRLTGLIR